VARLLASVDESAIVEAFSRMDADGSGKIELRELHQVLFELDESISEADARDVAAACDTSGDGHVSLLELLNAKRARPPASVMASTASAVTAATSERHLNLITWTC